MATFRVLTGDSLKLLKKLPANSVDSCVCDPPYGLEFMGKQWDKFAKGRSAKYKSGGKLHDPADRRGKGGAGPQYISRPAKRCANCNKQAWSGSPCKCHNPLWKLDNSPLLSFQQFNEAWAREVLRVLKPGGHLLAFGGTRTYHRMVCAIEDAGFEIRDQIGWLYGSGFPKSLDVSKAIDKAAGAKRNDLGANPNQRGRTRDKRGGNLMTPRIVADCGNHSRITTPATPAAQKWQGWGTALKPAWEPIVLARKPLTQRTVAENVQRFGTGAINVDACRVGSEKIVVRGGSKSGNGFAFCANYKQVNLPRVGRWPANVIHDGSDEVLAEFAKFGESKSPNPYKYNGKHEPQKEIYGIGLGWRDNHQFEFGDTGTAARFFYCAKASKRDRDEGCGGALPVKEAGSYAQDEWTKKNMTFATKRRNHHPTVKPTALMRYLCKLVTPKGGTVLDPFTGSGSTGKAAVLEGFSFIGCELSKEYSAIAKARITAAVR